MYNCILGIWYITAEALNVKEDLVAVDNLDHSISLCRRSKRQNFHPGGRKNDQLGRYKTNPVYEYSVHRSRLPGIGIGGEF